MSIHDEERCKIVAESENWPASRTRSKHFYTVLRPKTRGTSESAKMFYYTEIEIYLLCYRNKNWKILSLVNTTIILVMIKISKAAMKCKKSSYCFHIRLV